MIYSLKKSINEKYPIGDQRIKILYSTKKYLIYQNILDVKKSKGMFHKYKTETFAQVF